MQCVIDTQHTIWFKDQNMTLKGSDSQVPKTQDVHVAGEHAMLTPTIQGVCECVSVRKREREKHLYLLHQSLFSFPLKLSPTMCLEEWTESAKL